MSTSRESLVSVYIIPYILLLFIGLTRSRFQTPHCLRQHGTSSFDCGSFFRSASEKTNHKKKVKHRLHNWHAALGRDSAHIRVRERHFVDRQMLDQPVAVWVERLEAAQQPADIQHAFAGHSLV